MIVLRIGDPHVKPNNLKESEALLDFVFDTAVKLKVDRVEFLGDLYDTHNIVRLEVLNFWTRHLNRFSKQSFKTIVLVGNHDMGGDYSDKFSALHTLLHLEGPNFKIVHEPYLDGVYGYLPYIHSDKEFVEESNKLANLGATVLVSHPNFKGAVYDNGHPINAGVDPASLSPLFLHLIGGHIHTELEFGRVWYTGNPRWLTKSCANKKKGIWLVVHDDSGAILSKELISTSSVCTPITSLVWKEGEDRPSVVPGTNTNIELVGSSEWVTKQKLDLVGVTLSSKITDSKKTKERSSGKSLVEFLTKHYQAVPEKKAKLLKYLGDLDLV